MGPNGNSKPSTSRFKPKKKYVETPANEKSKGPEPTEKFSKTKSKEKGKAIEKVLSPSPSHSEIAGESEDSEDEGIDEEGMARLMEALGEDGLDELGRAQLEALPGESRSKEEDEESEAGFGDQEVDNVDETGALSDQSSEDDQEDESEEAYLQQMPIDEAASVDEDAIPHQKLEIDNKVRNGTRSRN